MHGQVSAEVDISWTSRHGLRRKTRSFQPEIESNVQLRFTKSKSIKSPKCKSSKSSKSKKSKGSKSKKSSADCTAVETSEPSPTPSVSLAPSVVDCASDMGRLRDVEAVVQQVSGSLSFPESAPQGLALEWLRNVDTSNACNSITTISVSFTFVHACMICFESNAMK